jgi:hypothetical protein
MNRKRSDRQREQVTQHGIPFFTLMGFQLSTCHFSRRTSPLDASQDDDMKNENPSRQAQKRAGEPFSESPKAFSLFTLMGFQLWTCHFSSLTSPLDASQNRRRQLSPLGPSSRTATQGVS